MMNDGLPTEPVWDPVAQIYVGGVVPTPPHVQELLAAVLTHATDPLRLFGYGSLCWNPGTGVLSHPSVTRTLGRARGYRRIWAQRSTDHRGSPTFPGLVCTLLTDAEIQQLASSLSSTRASEAEAAEPHEPSWTEGVLYEVPPDLAAACLAELDFREKGGYARDVIDVIRDDQGPTVPALLYRGTPENPAFWLRAYRDLAWTAAVMSVAVGPSGRNDVYLERLAHFLTEAALPGTLEKWDDTLKLHAMVQELQASYDLYFLYGAGSNQHNQLLLASAHQAAGVLRGDDEAHEWTELFLCVPRSPGTTCTSSSPSSRPDGAGQILAGGGHSGLLTQEGRLFLFGWHEQGQLGRGQIRPALGGGQDDDPTPSATTSPWPVVEALPGILVEKASLGFAHTLVVEKGTHRLYAFGENGHGQVLGKVDDARLSSVNRPVTPDFLAQARIADLSAGVFHSAALEESGPVWTWGHGGGGGAPSSWPPPEGARWVQVRCGRYHTVALDDRGRVWTWGHGGGQNCNKYGQLGREMVVVMNEDGSGDQHEPRMVSMGPEEDEGAWWAYNVACGWSHTVVLARRPGAAAVTTAWGWGRNDRGQLGTGSTECVRQPQRLLDSHWIQSVSCGSESTVVVARPRTRDDEEEAHPSSWQCWACGWNEHGHLADGTTEHRLTLTATLPALSHRGPDGPQDAPWMVAAGGAHMLAMRIAPEASASGE